MKNIDNYIIEKFKISSDIKAEKVQSLIEKAENADTSKQYKRSWSWALSKDMQKMRDYKAKGSKPERLVATIKDNDKLERRFIASVDLKWEDAINVFGQALIDRNIHPEEDVLICIKRNYIDKR